MTNNAIIFLLLSLSQLIKNIRKQMIHPFGSSMHNKRQLSTVVFIVRALLLFAFLNNIAYIPIHFPANSYRLFSSQLIIIVRRYDEIHRARVSAVVLQFSRSNACKHDIRAECIHEENITD